MNTHRLRFALPRPVPTGLFRRVPPAAFAPILGALGLVLAWRGGVGAFALPPGLAQMAAGMVVALWLFAAVAYAAKLARRPAVLAEDLATLPGRAGVAGAVLSIYLGAALLGGPAGRALLVAGIAAQGAMLAVLLRAMRDGPVERRVVTPVWHLSFTGIIVAARAAVALGWDPLGAALFWPAVAIAVIIYAASVRQAARGWPTAPLRPLLAIHLAPVALFGTVALGLGWTGAAQALGWLALGGLAVLVGAARWLLAAGFSALWGALTFPVAATAGLWVALWRAGGGEVARLIAGGTLILATLLILPILVLILRDWARGRLAVKTNAAIA